MTALSHGIRLLPGGGRRGTRAPPATLLVRVLLVAVATIAFAALLWSLSSERRAIRALPPEQRVALVSRGVDELRGFCGEGRPSALNGHCHELASFLAQFDECKGECEALVRAQLTPKPTR